MKKNIKWIAGILAFVMIIGGAYALYTKLTKNYSDPNMNSQSQSEEEKAMAPDFTVTDKDGKEIKLSDLRGKPVVINFWATWCGYCKVEMPDFEKMYKKYGSDVQFMMVNMTDNDRETKEKAQSYINENGYTFPVFFDTLYSAAYNYNVMSLPATYFINEKGELVANARGALDEKGIEQGINMLLNSESTETK